MTEPSHVPAGVLHAFGFSPHAVVSRIAGGLINQTLLIEDGDHKSIMQLVNPIFAPSVHLDIEAITAHLEQKGVTTPRLKRTRDGTLWATDSDGKVWRVLTWLPGRVVNTVDSTAMAHAAGGLVARFHRAVADLDHVFHFTRPGAHDTPAHLKKLRKAVDEHVHHPNRDAVAPIAERILAHAARLPELPPDPRRIIHGDLKISNLLFHYERVEAVALLDLDTMGRLTIPVELGDAFRSWCNPAGEDAGSVVFRADLYEAAIKGYAVESQGFLTRAEREALPAGTETIAVELAARFCADALNESYFGWNPARFPSRSEHNRVRALAQINLAADIARQRAQLEEITARSFAAV